MGQRVVSNLFRIIFVAIILASCQMTDSGEAIASNESVSKPEPKNEEAQFNEELAKELNADPWGLSNYVLVYLKSGPNRSEDKVELAKLQQEHLVNISRLADEGYIVLAGPFLDGDQTNVRGIFIMNVSSLEEAKSLTESDPMIESGHLVAEYHPWMGSSAIKKINEIHKSIAKESFN